MQVKAFEPSYGSGQSITVTATAVSATWQNTGNDHLLLSVVGTLPVWVRVTDSNSTVNAAVTVDQIVLPSLPIIIGKTKDYERISAVSTGAGSTLYINPGRGI